MIDRIRVFCDDAVHSRGTYELGALICDTRGWRPVPPENGRRCISLQALREIDGRTVEIEPGSDLLTPSDASNVRYRMLFECHGQTTPARYESLAAFLDTWAAHGQTSISLKNLAASL
ncbi:MULTISPECIES: hypothetical protein [Mycobacterium]|uniref:Uncharacterized protein n=1 Tax=Mycobacterium kiyosense TaxID=2871094 RepID=A0A9P3QBW2_9MYCO|nr:MULTISPECIES: hypothetical protein [Mycobacterium]BDB42842.1 hypothetical protein IWGMT90018_32880 [Mycobacterium kiyosense]BDE13919.1 hypothetical protein MKCMC460_27790 [Mycobacterium sp. 20KCMC460]GLB84629.1 hypothetical protein SRL2020028_38850 [Mycobacterium kiyosense]GLB91920.1 hypothetical protein SRL2020130_47370 [Mycobacterium kiyosense]GLB97977.1 hypothetical protein SRL2020226_47530 [Mycobacterium kiyosense]